MADILISIAAKIAEYPVEPILRQFGYLINFNKNVRNLNEQAEKLKDLKSQMNRKVERARKNGEEIDSQVKWWLKRVDEIIAEVEQIEDQRKTNKNCLSGPFPSCIYRYRVSRKSTKKLISIQVLQEKCKFDRISHPPKLPGIDYFSSKDIILFDSTKSTIDQILNALVEEETNIVVLHGTRGVGKTALAKELGKRAKAENFFDEVVIAFVSKTCDLEVIQGQLGDMLGLRFKEQSTSGRARRLNLRLKNEKILIILDGVWNNLDLEDIGIPTATDHKGCKILLTTQNENIWRVFGAGTKKVVLNPLSEEESWVLFKNIAGDIVDIPPFNVVAEDIVGKCKGLPVMLVEIGKKLKGKGIEQWKDMNRQIDYSEKKGENLDDFLDGFI